MGDRAQGNGGGTPAPLPIRWLVAVHEAAHAAYAHRKGVEVSAVTVEGIAAVENGAEREYGMSFGRCYPDWDGESEGAMIGLLGCALSLVGPGAAHKAGWPENLLLPYEEFLEVAEEHHPRCDAGCVLAMLRLAEEPKALYEVERPCLLTCIEDHYSEIVALAKMLMEKDTIGSSDISIILGPGWFEFRDMLRQMALEDDLAPWVKHAMEVHGIDDPDRISVGPDGEVIILDW